MNKTFSFQDKNSPEKLIAGLNIIGLHYVIGEGIESFFEKDTIGLPEDLIAGLVRQNDARLRSALIALFLYKPGYSKELPEALNKLTEGDRRILKIYYTAAVYLQQIHAQYLWDQIPNSVSLPNIYSTELGISIDLPPDDALKALASLHRETSGLAINWLGTYKHAAERLITRLQKEASWAV